jgi:hypothetical protein
MRGVVGGIAAAALTAAVAAALWAPAAAPADGEQLTVGVGKADTSWHVGASAGQYAGDCPAPEFPSGPPCTPVSHEDGTFDPTGHSTRRLPSYGIQSRLSARAIVVDGPAPGTGDRWALVKNDNYIPQDLVYRRAGEIIAQDRPDLGISPTNLTMSVTHDHSSPYYSSTGWGVWTFQDVFDIRFFEYEAQQMASAVEQAADGMKPARVGVDSSSFDKTHRNSMGPSVADDGTPSGYPNSDQDHDLTVIRFDDISNPSDPKPLVNLVNFQLHGEMLEGNDLISGDWVAPFERMLDRETGATTVYTQGSVGTSETERSSFHSIHERLEFTHRDYAHAEYAARLMANSAEDSWRDIADDSPDPGDKYISFNSFGSSPTVQMADHWYPGPLTHPYPGVSNCRTDSALHGDPRYPIVGLPDCENIDGALGNIGLPGPGDTGLYPQDPGLSTDDFQSQGIPVPENYGAPAYTGLEEDIDVHLQAVRIGGLLLPVCSCEQWWDQSRNIELRTDKIAGDETLPGNLGYDWGAQCTEDGNGTYTPEGDGTGTWHCPDPRNTSSQLGPLSDHLVKRMRAQVNNPANGWDDLANVATADSEPTDATQIKGNYTHDDSPENAALGYDLTVPIAMSNDYNGYIASYREFQRGDHYRKALTGWGPHSSDYMASRLVTLARQFNDPGLTLPQDQQDEQFYQPKITADLAVNDARAAALGTGGSAAIHAYEATLPDDGGQAEAVDQPKDIERFGASLFTWNGGSNFTDNPVVKVQRETAPGQWEDYADQSGELPVTLKFPNLQGDTPAYLQGDQQWHWTADFEAFVAGEEDRPYNTGDRSPATPAGNYRFVVHGERRQGHAVVPYDLTSDVFQVKPWDGVLVQDFKLESDDTMSFSIGPRSTYQVAGGGINGVGGDTISSVIGPIDYPDSYAGSDPHVAKFIRDQRDFERDSNAPNDPSQLEWYCFTCTFRPWIDFGDAQSAKVTITHGDGSTEVVPAHREGDRWATSRQLQPGESAQVIAGDVLDPYGDTNEASSILSKAALPPPDADGDGVMDSEDQCPSEPGPPSNHGCPEPPPPTDGDGDGVPDSADNCPNEPGTIDNYGCPAPQQGGPSQGGSQQGGPSQQGQPASPGPDPRCATLRAKLHKLGQSGAKPGARRKVRGRLHALGC